MAKNVLRILRSPIKIMVFLLAQSLLQGLHVVASGVFVDGKLPAKTRTCSYTRLLQGFQVKVDGGSLGKGIYYAL